MKEIIFIILAFIFGGLITWFYFFKIKKPQKTIEAVESVGASKENDNEREKIKKEILEQIKKNEELRKKIKEKIGE